MEGMENLNFRVNLFNNIYQNKKVFLTGNTGFKGSWMAFWLQKLGANVVGYSLESNTTPNHFSLLGLDYQTYFHNICDLDFLQKSMIEADPEIVFHLAAQPLVRYSYINPIETYQTNVMGTVNLLEASRNCKNLKAIVVITTDKCYENIGQKEGYKEIDRMGGFDPYSSSKGAAEIVVSSYRNSFFNLEVFQKEHNTLVASARAGNVIGGGDWSMDRLIPDIIISAVKTEKTLIRYPKSTRPWQHVLEPIFGYLLLGEKLLNAQKEFAEAWNFGPEENETLTVEEVLRVAEKHWNKIQYEADQNHNHFHEANLLSLNIDKAKIKLGWNPKWNSAMAIEKTINWYKEYYAHKQLLTELDLKNYINNIIQ